MEDGAALADALSPVFSAERVRASPHSLYLAVSSSYRLTVLDAKTLRMLHLFSCMDAIEHIEWSCDSKFIVCGIFARGLAQVWSTERPEWVMSTPHSACSSRPSMTTPVRCVHHASTNIAWSISR